MVRGAGLLPAGPAFTLHSWHPCWQSQQTREEVSGWQKHQEIVFPRRNWGFCPTCVKKRHRHSVPWFLWPSKGFQTLLPSIWSLFTSLCLRKRERSCLKKKADFLLQLLQLSSTKDLMKRESGGKISPGVCRKINPTCSFQCRKQQKGSCTGAVMLKDSEFYPYLPSLLLGTRADQPVCAYLQAYQNSVFFARLEVRFQNLVYPSCIGTIRYLERTGRFYLLSPLWFYLAFQFSFLFMFIAISVCGATSFIMDE